MSFKMRIDYDDEILIKSKAENIEEFEPLMKKLKIKFNGEKQ